MENGIKKAHDFVVEAHGTQKRKYIDVPYLVHLEETAQLLHEITEGTVHSDMYIAALLHDVVEDTDVTLQDVGREFGKRVMDLVEELTNDEVAKKAEGKKPYLSKKLNTMSKDAFLIKLCDRFSNVSGLENRAIPRDFVKWYIRETQYILDHLDREIDDTEKFMLNKIAKILVYLKLDRNING